MELSEEKSGGERDTPVCPLQDDPPQERKWLTREVELSFADHKRLFAQYRPGEAGVTQLHLYYGDKEISFDEPELFEFGEALAKRPRFVAGDAVEWGTSYDWPRIRGLLEQLVEGGVLLRASDAEREPLEPPELSRVSLLPPAPCPAPRTWLEADAIIHELFGRPFELSYLELVMPVYRVAHIAIDADGRQVGEANVWPKALRVDVPTEWRLCPHAGSRHHHDLPMNVSALKAMRAYWKPMMAALAQVREAYVRRFPQARGEMTVADVYCLSVLVLAIPAYLMMRTKDPVENGQLDPVLSSMFRVTDGVRLVMHLMMFADDVERVRPIDAAMTGDEIYAYAERNSVFIAAHGVCAGPRAMIDDFLQVLIHGRQVEDVASVALPDQVRAALGEFDELFDYAASCLRAWAVTHSQSGVMIRTFEALAPIVERWTGPAARPLRSFRERFEHSLAFLRTTSRESTEERRLQHERAYAAVYARSSSGLRAAPDNSLAQRLMPRAVGNDGESGAALRAVLSQQLAGIDDEAAVERTAEILMDYFRREQAIVRAATEIQHDINRLLGRSPPARPLTAADLAVNTLLRSTVWSPDVLAKIGGRLPYLPDLLGAELGWRLVITGEALDISRCAA